jgi:hypothetical protein
VKSLSVHFSGKGVLKRPVLLDKIKKKYLSGFAEQDTKDHNDP